MHTNGKPPLLEALTTGRGYRKIVGPLRILVLGGYGNFGRRICRALSSDDSLVIVAAGRHPPEADLEPISGKPQAVALDIDAPDLAARLRALSPDIVVNCVGPFQGQGYRVAEAAIGAGSHYVDLSDGREFVSGFAAAVNARAHAAGRLAVSGASTLPALSSAVVDALMPRFARLDVIDSIIAPAQRAPRGIATVAGVLSYAGRPFSCLDRGEWITRYGWMDPEPLDLGPVGHRLAADCDVPDLALFPERYPGVKTVRFRAALELRLQHRAIAATASLRRLGVSLPVERAAAAVERVACWLDRFGSETGGMQVSLEGVSLDGKPLQLNWRVVAPNNHGPEIPCMAAILLLRKWSHGELPAIGAHPCMGFLTLDEFQGEFARWRMTTEIEERRPK